MRGQVVELGLSCTTPCVLQDMQPCPGVRIEDMGHKMGCNGVDNGKLWFNSECWPHSRPPWRAPHGSRRAQPRSLHSDSCPGLMRAPCLSPAAADVRVPRSALLDAFSQVGRGAMPCRAPAFCCCTSWACKSLMQQAALAEVPAKVLARRLSMASCSWWVQVGPGGSFRSDVAKPRDRCSSLAAGSAC